MFSRTKTLSGLLAAGLVMLSVACGGGSASPVQNPDLNAVVPTPCAVVRPSTSAQNPNLNVISVGQDFGVGRNRLPLALLRLDQTSVNDRAKDLEVTYWLSTGGCPKKLDGMTWRAWPVLNGVYVGYPEFDKAGFWEFTVKLNEGGRTLLGGAFVEVKEKTLSPAVGDPAPATETKTASKAEDLPLITSSAAPYPDLYKTSLAVAVKSGMPTVVTFSTPAFCATRTCGPEVEVVHSLEQKYGAKVNFIHVEIYDNPREMLEKGDISIGRVYPAVTAWRLESEPWTFMIGKDGNIFARFEAFTTEDELESAVQAILAAT